MQDYVVIDLEMTGLNVKTDHILEVGAVKVRNHHAVDQFGAILGKHSLQIRNGKQTFHHGGNISMPTTIPHTSPPIQVHRR